MEIINITEEQRNKLCKELARLTFEFREDTNIKCIYFTPYKVLGNRDSNIIEVTLVRDESEEYDLNKKLKEYNLLHQSPLYLEEFGFRIILDTDNLEKYTIIDLNPSESKKSNDLMNSVILYDKTGYFTKIKTQTTNMAKDTCEDIPGVYYYYDNLATVIPPLDETLNKALDVARMERDTSAVKKFTKSKLFQQFKNM